jgi:hypothetical protein
MNTNATQSAQSLRNLYFTRTAVQLAWAGLVLAAATPPPLTIALLVAYPLWDVACTLYDLKHTSEARASQVANAILGGLTALAIALTAPTHLAYAIAAFGAWALIAGLLQLAAGLQRRKQLGGQWAMILSGAQSTLAGVAFVLGGLSGKLHPKDLGGYAIFGGVYFLIASILLHRKLLAGNGGHAEPVAGI